MPTIRGREGSKGQSSKGFAVLVAAPLLAFSLTHCGGKEINLEPSAGANVAGANSAEPTANGGLSAGAVAGYPSFSGDDSLIDPTPVGDETPSSCNAFQDTSSFVNATLTTSNPPEPKGGTLANGIYHLSNVEDYVAPGVMRSPLTSHRRSRIILSASTGLSAEMQINWMDVDGELPLPVEQNQSLLVTGTSYDYTVTCTTQRGSSAPGSLSFTANANELVQIHPDFEGVTRVETFTRQ